MSNNRQYVTVKFRPTDTRSYTYHNDGDPVVIGDEVKVEDRHGDGWKRVTVCELSDQQPQFQTKPILGIAPPLEKRMRSNEHQRTARLLGEGND